MPSLSPAPQVVALAVALVLASGTRAAAQDPPPPIGPFVVDVRGMLPSFDDSAALADSRGLTTVELPGRGIGLDVAAHAYPFHLGKITVGLGAQIMLARANRSQDAPLASVSSRFASVAPQLSLNFGSGDGWSYISGGIGLTRWSIVPDGAEAQTADTAWVRTFDGGGGARWFVKPRLAFHVDVRLHSIEPGPAQVTRPGSPRVRVLIVSAGVSVRPF